MNISEFSVSPVLVQVSSASNSVTEVSFHPKDHDVVCIVGRGIFRSGGSLNTVQNTETVWQKCI